MTVLTHQQAEAAVSAAFEAAAGLGLAVTVSIVDKGGHLLVLRRHEGANLVSLDLAIGKAYTALAMNLSTNQVAALIQPGQELYHLDLAVSGRPLVAFAGGIPLGTPLLGGIGVSGGSPDQDHQIAQAGAAAIERT